MVLNGTTYYRVETDLNKGSSLTAPYVYLWYSTTTTVNLWLKDIVVHHFKTASTADYAKWYTSGNADCDVGVSGSNYIYIKRIY
ncbi:MAG: hypothetical protein LBV33_04440 [Lachnospiraceae bacterium]|jgi:hypothetical protein|nr:hypothetical protein [Lachnospiraceae bacterium]